MKEFAKDITINISHAAEIISAIVIGIAIIAVMFNYILLAFRPLMTRENIRIQFGSSVAVALELLLGADVLATAVAPSWDDIGQLASIAVIRTALNYFLGKELKEHSV